MYRIPLGQILDEKSSRDYIDETLNNTQILGKDHHISLTKAITWRVIASLTTIIISYIVTGSAQLALSIGVLDVIFKLILYYFHERLWGALTGSTDSNVTQRP